MTTARDPFDSHAASLTTPPSSAAPIAPSDTVDLPFVTRAIYIGTPGDLRVLTRDGQDVIYRNLSGTKVIRATRVLATGTTAGDLVGEW